MDEGPYYVRVGDFPANTRTVLNDYSPELTP